MIVKKINHAKGFHYGLQGVGKYNEYKEWFETEEERNNCIDLNNFGVILE